MNVFLRKQLLLCCLLMLFSGISYGQLVTYYYNLQTSQGQSVTKSITAISNPANQAPYLAPTPKNGSVQLNRINSSQYEVVYTPNVGFTGIDTFKVAFFECPGFCPRAGEFKVTVQSSASILANHDYTFTTKNSATSVNVLANDTSSNGVLKLTAIPLANNGTATINGNAIQFTPNPNFEGIAYFNYVVCNGSGLCDNGTVTVQVLGDNARKSDTLRVFTKKNQSQVILIPNTFSITANPTNGTYSTSGDAPVYQPNANFVGTDLLRFQSGNTSKWVEVVVLDVEANTLAFDDDIYTSPGEPIEVNVLANDLHKEQSGCFAIQDQPQAGTIEFDNNGLVTYYPAAGFTGVDWFTYTVQAPGCTGAVEMATAYVYVSNFEPAYTKFRMYTPQGTPLVIGNDVPIENFKYQVKAQGTLGKVIILEGRRDTLIQGQRISGNNIILYQPLLGILDGTDEFELTYCVLGGQNGCAYEKSIKVEVEILNIINLGSATCLDDCVWPGDTNQDGIVNIEDILPIGVEMGEVGVPRSEQHPQWFGRSSNDWNGNPKLKHIDTNGDSIISALDTAAISTHYGKTHGIKSTRPVFYKYNLELQGDVFINPGDVVELNLVLGSEEQPIADLYGFTFPFEYNPLVFDPASVRIDFSNASWFGYNSPVLYMSRNNDAGLVEAGATRTSGVAAKGFGEVGTVKFVVRDDVLGIRLGDEETVIEVGGGISTVSNSAGQRFGVNVKPAQLHIVRKTEAEIKNTPLTDDLLKVYPNPAQDLLNVHLNGGQEFETLLVYNLTGQVVYQMTGLKTNRAQINVSNLQDGLYIVSIKAAKGVVKKKFEVIR